MPLGTLDRTPPPFFRQGYSALTKLLFFSSLAVFLMVADTRFALVGQARSVLATVLRPVQLALKVPIEMWEGGQEYLLGLQHALASERAAQAKLVAQADRLARAAQLEQENEQLRSLLGLGTALQVRSVAAQVLYEAPDPFSRKVFIDRGTTHGVVAGAPVVNHDGVFGQVTRVYAMSSEVTLMVDKDAAIPVLNRRTSQRGVAFGGVDGGTAMELRFMTSNADVEVGDELVTSGLDAVYPAALPVARVATVDRQSDGNFARVLLKPSVQPDGVRQVLVLEPLRLRMPARDEPHEAAAATTRP